MALAGRVHSLRFFIFLPRCPNTARSSLERKDPLTLPQAQGCSPSAGEKGGSVFPRRSWRINWKIRAPRETHLLDLEGISAYTGNKTTGAEHQSGVGSRG